MGNYMDPLQKDILNIAFSAAAVLGFIIFYFVYIFLKQKKIISEWQQARIKAEIDTLENERKRIASDLHDELGPMLSAIKLQVNHLEPTDETEKLILEKSSGQIDEIIQRFREISYNLLPNTLVRKGLTKAVDEFIGKMSETHAISIQFHYPKELKVAVEKEINIYRIIQEITHNTIKHSRANELTIKLDEKTKELVLQTKDNGIGFNYTAQQNNSSGLGLLNLQSRVAVLNAQLLVITEPGKGTQYLITIPI
jgi:two-component system, NarL family, sensor kinase